MASYITCATPLQWSSSTPYEALTLVVDSNGTGYISKKQVPSGTVLTNSEYWTKVPNLARAVSLAQQSADSAQQSANSAAEAAEDAKNTATAANSAAASASASAQQAITAAGQASTAASKAQNSSDLAQRAALAAQYMAEMSAGIYPIS